MMTPGILLLVLTVILAAALVLQLSMHARTMHELGLLAGRLGKLERLLGEDGSVAGSIEWAPAWRELGASGPLHGQPAPTLALTTLEGTEISAATLRGQSALLLFIEGGCSSCRLFLAKLLEYIDSAPLPLGLPPTTIILGEQVLAPEIAETATDGVRVLQVILPAGHELRSKFGVSFTPYAVVLDSDGLIIEDGYVTKLEQLLKVAGRSATTLTARQTHAQ